MEKVNLDKLNSKILIVDDNAANVKLLEKILNINGFKNIRTLTDSKQVLAVYGVYKPDLLLLDLKMPYINGFDVLERMRIEDPNYLPVIVISAQNDIDNRLKALNLGAQDFIAKPFNSTEVMLRVNNFLNLHFSNKTISMKNTELENSIEEKNKELQEMQKEVIERLLRAIEFRDFETGDHIYRISQYTTSLAKTLGMPQEEIEDLSYASLMHDIGKIGVQDSILNKRGTLTADEMNQMRTHTIKGAEILKGSHSKVIQVAEQIALTHHERWDGQGYPKGLDGPRIPLVGRIVALVDVFDALISERPYKEAWTFDEAVSYINKQKGTHFDPTVVDAFVKCLPEIKKIREKFLQSYSE